MWPRYCNSRINALGAPDQKNSITSQRRQFERFITVQITSGDKNRPSMQLTVANLRFGSGGPSDRHRWPSTQRLRDDVTN
jgi:hypothetical protein